MSKRKVHRASPSYILEIDTLEFHLSTSNSKREAAMKISFIRKGSNSFSPFAPRYEYTMAFGAFPKDRRGDGFIEFGFETNPKGKPSSSFCGSFCGEQFEELALLMVRADPQAAIRAFGTAMMEIKVEGSSDKLSKA